MNRTQKRLLGSFALSVSCAIASHIWYKSTSAGTYDGGGKQPIAQLIESSNEVQRKPLKRLIWQTLSDNDQLFSGEQIRTTQNSEARIQIVKTGTIISLEPDSLITLDEKDGELSLDFLQGNLFVKGGKGDDSLKLKTGGQEIAIGGADVSLGKGQSGKLDVQVFSGQVDGVQNSQDPFQITFPGPQAEVHVSPDGKDSVGFEFKKVFSQTTNVILELGKSRTDLKAVTDSEKQPQKILAKLQPGDYYWRLVASDPSDPSQITSSGIYRIRIFPKRPPVPLFPEKEQIVNVPDETPQVAFRWANPGKLKDLVIEVASSNDFKTNKQELRVKDQDFLEMPFKTSGIYYWRVTGYLKSNEAVPSSVYKFNLKIGGEISQPILELPAKGEKVGFGQMKARGVALQWKGSSMAKSYTVKIKPRNPRDPANSQVREDSAPTTSLKIKDLTPGVYEWTVAAVAQDGKVSKPSEVWTFSVEDLPVLPWKDNQAISYYEGTSPELKADWLPGPKGSETYKLVIRPEEGSSEENISIDVKQTTGSVPVQKTGRYVASVEALNAQGVVIAKTNDRTIEVKPAPLLEAPVFVETLANPLKSSRRGDADVEWNPVAGATGYVVEVVDGQGNVVKEEKPKTTKQSLKKLKPGEFKLTVRAVDAVGRKGQVSEVRSLLVPDSSDVRAPKMMKIKVQ